MSVGLKNVLRVGTSILKYQMSMLWSRVCLNLPFILRMNVLRGSSKYRWPAMMSTRKNNSVSFPSNCTQCKSLGIQPHDCNPSCNLREMKQKNFTIKRKMNPLKTPHYSRWINLHFYFLFFTGTFGSISDDVHRRWHNDVSLFGATKSDFFVRHLCIDIPIVRHVPEARGHQVHQRLQVQDQLQPDWQGGFTVRDR